MYSQPGKQGASLVWRESIDFEHGHRMRANRFLTEATNHKLCVSRNEERHYF